MTNKHDTFLIWYGLLLLYKVSNQEIDKKMSCSKDLNALQLAWCCLLSSVNFSFLTILYSVSQGLIVQVKTNSVSDDVVLPQFPSHVSPSPSLSSKRI